MGVSIDYSRLHRDESTWEGAVVRIGSLGDAVKVGLVEDPAGQPSHWAALSVAPAVRLAASLLLSASETADNYGAPLTKGDVRKYFREVGLDLDSLTDPDELI